MHKKVKYKVKHTAFFEAYKSSKLALQQKMGSNYGRTVVVGKTSRETLLRDQLIQCEEKLEQANRSAIIMQQNVPQLPPDYSFLSSLQAVTPKSQHDQIVVMDFLNNPCSSTNYFARITKASVAQSIMSQSQVLLENITADQYGTTALDHMRRIIQEDNTAVTYVRTQLSTLIGYQSPPEMKLSDFEYGLGITGEIIQRDQAANPILDPNGNPLILIQTFTDEQRFRHVLDQLVYFVRSLMDYFDERYHSRLNTWDEEDTEIGLHVSRVTLAQQPNMLRNCIENLAACDPLLQQSHYFRIAKACNSFPYNHYSVPRVCLRDSEFKTNRRQIIELIRLGIQSRYVKNGVFGTFDEFIVEFQSYADKCSTILQMRDFDFDTEASLENKILFYHMQNEVPNNESVNSLNLSLTKYQLRQDDSSTPVKLELPLDVDSSQTTHLQSNSKPNISKNRDSYTLKRSKHKKSMKINKDKLHHIVKSVLEQLSHDEPSSSSDSDSSNPTEENDTSNDIDSLAEDHSDNTSATDKSENTVSSDQTEETMDTDNEPSE